MTKFFLAGAQQKRRTPDYRVIGYFKLLECVKKVRLFIIQKTVKQLRKEPSDELEKRLEALKSCHPATMRKIAAYMLKHSCNIELDKQERFFETKLGCSLSEAIAEIDEYKSGEGQYLLGALENHALFQQALDEMQEVLNRVQKKISQTKHRKEAKRQKVRMKKQQLSTQLEAQDDAPQGTAPHEVEQSPEKRQPPRTKFIKRQPTETQRPKESTRVKTRYDNRPAPRTEFKKKGRNKHLQKEKQHRTEPQHKKAPNPFLSANQSTHPSWEAKQQLGKIQPFQGKRILLS